jgi:hypothetical protein
MMELPARDAHEAAEGLQQRVVTGLVLQRPFRAEGADRAIDEARLLLAERGGIEPELRRGARPEILDHHIRALEDQPLEPGAVGGIAQIHHHRELVAIEALEQRRVAVPIRRRPFAGVVAVLLLDLDHGGAEVAQDLARERSRHVVPELDHHDVPKRRAGGHFSPP